MHISEYKEPIYTDYRLKVIMPEDDVRQEHNYTRRGTISISKLIAFETWYIGYFMCMYTYL